MNQDRLSLFQVTVSEDSLPPESERAAASLARSISIAVDRLVEKGLVSRVESAEDRRVRIVALTPSGKDLITGAFRKLSLQMKRVFSELSPEEFRGLETSLKKIGKRATTLMEQS